MTAATGADTLRFCQKLYRTFKGNFVKIRLHLTYAFRFDTVYIASPINRLLFQTSTPISKFIFEPSYSISNIPPDFNGIVIFHRTNSSRLLPAAFLRRPPCRFPWDFRMQRPFFTRLFRLLFS